MANKAVWGIHSGSRIQFEPLFLNDKVVGVGWGRLGDIRSFGSDRERIKTTMAREYPDTKPGALPGYATMFSWFCNDVHPEDLILYPRMSDRTVHYGLVAGPYTFAGVEAPMPHRRAIRWVKVASRAQFSLGALKEISQGSSFFRVASFADEFLAVLAGTASGPTPPEGEATDDFTQEEEEVKQSTEDFVLSRLYSAYKGRALEHLVANLFETMGYHVQLNPEGVNGAYDLRASRGILGIEPPILKIECKSSETDRAGEKEVNALLGQLVPGEYAVFISLNGFTPNAKVVERDKRSTLRTLTGASLTTLILEHYERLDPRHKAAIPLKRIYIPDVGPSDDKSAESE